MSRMFAVGLTLATALLGSAATPALASQDEVFFDQVVGHWTGPGEIVAGKYKGTKFVCDFSGQSHPKKVGMALDGSCRVGLFSQKMRAEVVKSGSSYTGEFQDGADGSGLDIVSGSVDRNRMVVGLDRKQLKGAMVARLDGHDTMNITVSVHVAGDLVPVIGMNLKRTDAGVKQSALVE
ncbi:MAG TPA: hypothetical protein VFJ13_08550 [Paracoccaceae bacterium]|nr:hypothetical protein [Paracoccaceae bacterium]